jgi:molybdate transport system ATP-binding protein
MTVNEANNRARDSNRATRGLRLSARMSLNGAAGPFELDVDLSIAAGSFVALIGPSGAGKTTLLRILAGLARPAAGCVRVGDAIWCDTSQRLNVPTRQRAIGFVFQDYALFPNMTVRGNVEYALGSRARANEVTQLLKLVDLDRLETAFPARLSGGQKQRLALIRALARRPALLMLDEPLSALDPAMRRQLQDELKRLHRGFGTTTLMVSHDVSEIFRLADRVIRLDQGLVVYDGPPGPAFGVEDTTMGLQIIGQHVSGPDQEGFATVSIDGRLHRLRYRGARQNLSPGDTVALNIEEGGVQCPR